MRQIREPVETQGNDQADDLVTRPLVFVENANDSLKGRVMEFSLGDLNKEEDQAFRKIKLRIEDVKVRFYAQP